MIVTTPSPSVQPFPRKVTVVLDIELEDASDLDSLVTDLTRMYETAHYPVDQIPVHIGRQLGLTI